MSAIEDCHQARDKSTGNAEDIGAHGAIDWEMLAKAIPEKILHAPSTWEQLQLMDRLIEKRYC